MTALSKSMKRKLSLLQLAEELGNVARACKIMGYHRDSFYEVRRAFQTGGVVALVEQRRGARAPHPNRVAPEIEARVLEYCLGRPTHGAQRVSNELRLAGVEVSPSGVRGVWLRNDLETRYKRLMRLERESREHTTFVLSDEQVRLLERHSPEFRERRVESSAPGELLNQDTFYWGTLKGVGKVYVQVVIDTFCSLAFAKCYGSKMPITACDLLYERVLPFYDAPGVPVKAILTDNGREFCGKPESHPYELLLSIGRGDPARSRRLHGVLQPRAQLPGLSGARSNARSGVARGARTDRVAEPSFRSTGIRRRCQSGFRHQPNRGGRHRNRQRLNCRYAG